MPIKTFLTSFAVLLCLHSYSQLSINALGVNNQITFDAAVPGVIYGAYTGTGLSPVSGTGRLNSNGWRIVGLSGVTSNYGDTNTSGYAARGTTASGTPVMSGGLYSVSGTPFSGKALLIQPSSNAFDNTTGFIELRCLNNTTDYITSVNLYYRLYVRNDEARSTYVNPSIEQTFFSTHTAMTGYDITTLDQSTPLTSSGTSWTQNIKSEAITGLAIAPGEYFFVKFNIGDAGGSGSRDEIALDFISINANGGPTLDFYTQNSGEQLGTPSGSQLWSTVPNGLIKYGMAPFISTSNYTIQDTHTCTLKWSSMSINDLTVENGGRIQGDYPGNPSTLIRYLNVNGDIQCDGNIGDPSGAGAGIAFNFEAGDHVISGTGAFNCSRIRKNDNPALQGICNLDFLMDARLHYPGTSIYNDRPTLDGGTNIFNVRVSAGSTLKVDYNAAMDGTTPTTNNGNTGGGSYDIYGTMEVGRITYMRTDNTTIPCSPTIRTGGKLITGESYNSASGTAGHSLLVETGGILEFQGFSALNPWNGYSTVNNSYTLDPGSTVIFSRDGGQYILMDLEYRNLILKSFALGNRFAYSLNGTTTLTIREDLHIQGGARYIPGSTDILINGSWTNYNQSGFTEGTSLVIFENLSPGATIINTSGGEQFYDLEIRSGTVDLNSAVDVINDLDLFRRLNLNSNNLLIRNPALTTLGTSPYGIVVSEDILHQGSMTVTVNSYVGNVIFPFGTASGDPIYCDFVRTGGSGSAGQVTMATYPTGADNLPHPVSPLSVNNLTSSTGLVPDNRTATVDRFWSINTTGTSVNANIALSFLQTEMPSTVPFNDVSMIRAQRYDNTLDRWQPSLAGQTVQQNSPIAGIHRILVPSVTQFSPWAAASENSPLPVELLTFDGKRIEKGIQLDWSTATEINNSHFLLTRFNEKGEEEHITTVQGSGNSSTQLDYGYLDEHPKKGWNYYQLYQVDFDGTESDEGTAAVYWDETETLSMSSYVWNQSGLQIQITGAAGPVQYTLYDLQGRRLQSGVWLDGSSTIQVTPSSESIFLLHLEDGVSFTTEKILFNRP